MSKGLEALDSIICTFLDKDSEDIQIVKKELKALEIIRNKHIPKCALDTLEQDWNLIEVKGKDITQEEYELLKEVLL